MIIKTTDDPARTHNLSEFLHAGRNDKVVSYGDLSYQERDGNIMYTVKNILNDYLAELKEVALIVVLSDEEYMKYVYNPKRLAYDIYGSTELYYIIMMLNDIASIRDFDMKRLLMIRRSDLTEILAHITTGESRDIAMYNSGHN